MNNTPQTIHCSRNDEIIPIIGEVQQINEPISTTVVPLAGVCACCCACLFCLDDEGKQGILDNCGSILLGAICMSLFVNQ